jgi:hypothetical protein
MRRTTARQPILPPDDADGCTPLADVRCYACGERVLKSPLPILCLGANANGAFEPAFCGRSCAEPHGWPSWPSERQPTKRERRA